MIDVLLPGCRVCAYDAGDDVRIELVEQRDGAIKWAVRLHGSVLNCSLEWEYEPTNSSRDDAFYARARYATPEDALTILRASRQGDNHDIAERDGRPT